MSNVKSSKSDRWYTPEWIIKLAKDVMGQIDIDPCSDESANSRVGARHFLTDYHQNWGQSFRPLSAFVNPPGGKTENRSNQGLVWAHGIEQIEAGNLKEMFFLAFSVEGLQVTQRYDKPMGAYPTLHPPKRLPFIDGATGEPVKGNLGASALIYVPGTVDNSDRFLALGSKFGSLQVPASWYQQVLTERNRYKELFELEVEAQAILAKSSCSLMVA